MARRVSRLYQWVGKCQRCSPCAPLAPAHPHPYRSSPLPQVKRSNWSPPTDTGLWALADRVRARVLEELHGPVRERLDAELAYFDAVTAVSGKLYPVPKVRPPGGCWMGSWGSVAQVAQSEGGRWPGGCAGSDEAV